MIFFLPCTGKHNLFKHLKSVELWINRITNIISHIMKSALIIATVITGFGVIATVVAILLQVLVPKIVSSKLKDNLVIKNDNSTARFQQWKSPTISLRIKFFVFDIINGPDVKKGKSPSLVEKGPYVYREFMNKMNIYFNHSEPAVSYDQKKWFTFENVESCRSCDPHNDTVTTINAPYMIMAEVANTYSGFTKFVINSMLIANKEELLMTKTVHELVWGYNDTLFELFVTLREKWGLTFIPKIDPFMNYQPNNTYDGFVTVNTGAQDISKVGVWETWKRKHSLDLWKTKYANMFNGSDGTQFPPGVTRDETLYFFSPNLCRSIYLKFDSKKEIKDIDTLRFTTPEELFQNSTQHPSNAAFCQHNCYPNGILAGAKDCKRSKSDSPIVVSTPHFLYGGPIIRDSVKGLHPDKEKHGLFLSIEPTTGIPLQALIRLQLNLHIREISGIPGTKGIREAYIPVVYFSNEATIDDGTAKSMRNDLILPLEICYYAKIGLFCLGGLLIVVGIAMFSYYVVKSNRSKLKVEGKVSERRHLIIDT